MLLLLLLKLECLTINKSISLHLCSLCFRHPLHSLFLLFFSPPCSSLGFLLLLLCRFYQKEDLYTNLIYYYSTHNLDLSRPNPKRRYNFYMEVWSSTNKQYLSSKVGYDMLGPLKHDH